MDNSRDIWNRDDWVRRRQIYRGYAQWYDGVYLDASNDKRDRETGDKIRKFPLHLNMTRLMCDIHGDIARGIPNAGTPLIVYLVVERNGRDSGLAEKIETIVNDGVWRPSHGAAIQQEALLSMNIFGGTAFKLSWEPWDTDLIYRLAVRPIKDPSYILPVWDPQNPWRMLECYYGFEISPEIAKAKYGITPKSDIPVLYLEHWTRSEWKVTIDDKVPTVKWKDREWKLQGENSWGFVPIYYIPHKRTIRLFGDSQVEGATELEKDINSKMATISDIIRSARPGMLWGHDLDPNLKIKRVMFEGSVVTYVIDTGRTRNISGAQPPTLDALPMPDIPASIAAFPQDLLNFWMMLSRISPAAFGLDDSKSGRITGPVVANRMWTSISHGVEERINFTTIKTMMDKDIIRILIEREAAGEFTDLGVSPPGISGDVTPINMKQSWPPMIPTDRTAKHIEMIDRLRDGGISIETYLSEMGVDDTEEERARIENWLEKLAEIEASSQPEPFGGNNEPGNQPQS